MFEQHTYEALVKSALANVPNGVDKREGSMVFNGVAPSMAELAQLFIGLDFVFKATYLRTAPREYLIKRASDFRLTATWLPSMPVPPYSELSAILRCRWAPVSPARTSILW